MRIPFDYTLDYENLDLRKRPDLYKVGKGEQGVLSVEPYKGEILPFWRFKNPEIARKSSSKIMKLFKDYLKNDDFVGADMARKFLQMGYTRARRYANHKSGRKYSKEDRENPSPIGEIPPYKTQKNRDHHVKTRTKKVLAIDPDPIKAEAASIFYEKYVKARENSKYKKMKKEHIIKYETKN